MRARRSLLFLAVLLPLLQTAAACHPDGRWSPLTPRDGAVTTSDVAVRLFLLPFASAPRMRLDGERLDLSGFSAGPWHVSGTLEDLEPGPHRLAAWYRFLYLFPIGAVAEFEVGAEPSFEARASVNQVYVTHATPGEPLELRDGLGRVVAEAEADEQGSRVFREVEAGSGYRVVARGGTTELSDPLRVLTEEESLPPREFYTSQTLEPGYGYITTRDGTQLSVFVSLPGPPEEGPYPTLVNYSGYEPSKPGGALELGDLDLSVLCGSLPLLCAAPNHPSGLIAGFLGYATVGVNMRGTGCSGGAYDFFEPLQVLDGYDAIEVIAAQDWVLHNEVGMAGLSYPGISQLFVASARPPSLAAITPLSVISGTDTTLAPGGIVNDGFAVEWGTQVLDRADPYGQGWEQDRVDAGDGVCEENQLLHSQKVDIIQKAYDNRYYVPEIYDPLNPRSFVDRIEVPVFTAGQWQDEQTGGHFADLWDRFTSAPIVKRTATNGAHADGYSPQILIEWKTFLDFYVAREIRPVPEVVEAFGPLLFDEIFGAEISLPEPRFEPSDDFEAALAAYEAEPEVRILFESGGGANGSPPGAPEAGFELLAPSWPLPDLTPERWYFHGDGSLRTVAPPANGGASSFAYDPDKGDETFEVDDAFEKALPDITWAPWEPGRQVVFASDPLAEDRVAAGFASADLWVRSTADDADLEVLVSEIRPDGQEVYVSSGWLRASQRALSPGSTALRPIPTRLEADLEPLPDGVWEEVRVEIYPFAHVFRAGSRIRISVSSPGANRGRWKFDTLQPGEPVTHAVGHAEAFASSVLLPVLPGLEAPTPLPSCPGLRSQPCREHVPHLNASFE